ncbi:putative hydrolase of the HAD superfamily [Tistlia consotensis]|uniref:Putative hydrolase of the HAD superfamily n=1 Tax=Tistlia consotensis USBA 355 TaxID=560819 RepID=A0A1Y6C163_9PROT|nr:HAD-IA family hydrolase [Tistlia consotensis]SMF30983.1 putative hydrolase of the HAD superfamily [Tistlia consotensis USBA 355]SNS19432.1 putative hydrolase of the HAD superfamily [Tistlia consotensis]
MAKPLASFRYMTFDVVGTLIDFEAGLVAALEAVAGDQDVRLDGEEALALYRAARYHPEALRFPDDLERVYGVIAPQLGLAADPLSAARLRASVSDWKPFADSVAALAELRRSHRLIAMTNARRWAFELFDAALGRPFHAAFTVDDTGTEKPDPAFFRTVFAFVESEGGQAGDILHVAQSQYHDIGVSRRLGMTNCWIERRHDRPGYGGTIEPAERTRPDSTSPRWPRSPGPARTRPPDVAAPTSPQAAARPRGRQEQHEQEPTNEDRT